MPPVSIGYSSISLYKVESLNCKFIENEDYFNCLENFNITKAFLFSFFCSPFIFLFKVFIFLLEWNFLSFIGLWGFLVGSDGKESLCNVGDPGSIPGLGRSPGEENGYLFQYSCLENSMDRGAWQVTVHGVAKSRTQLNG